MTLMLKVIACSQHAIREGGWVGKPNNERPQMTFGTSEDQVDPGET